MAKLVALLLLNTGVVFSSSDLFSSMSDMEELYRHENTISEQMTGHLKVRFFFTRNRDFGTTLRSVNFKMSFWYHQIDPKFNESFVRISIVASKKRSNQKSSVSELK